MEQPVFNESCDIDHSQSRVAVGDHLADASDEEEAPEVENAPEEAAPEEEAPVEEAPVKEAPDEV